jgi:hypothetical protein
MMKMDRQEAERQADAIIAAARSHSRRALMQSAGGTSVHRRFNWVAGLCVAGVFLATFFGLRQYPLFPGATTTANVVVSALAGGLAGILFLVGALRRDVALLRAELADLQRHPAR